MKIEDAIKQSKPFRSEQTKLIVNIIYTHGWIESHYRVFFKEYDITKQQYNILRILRGSQMPISTSTIRDRMIDKMSDTPRLIKRMLKKDWLSKIVCNHDRRLVDIEISEKGLELLQQIDENIHKLDAINNLSDTEAATINRLLDKLRS